MLTQKMQDAYNEQINAEFYSAYMYLSMSAYLAQINLNGFANWALMQYHEENEHALKLYNYVIQRNGKVILEAIKKPKVEWDGVIDVFEAILKHEQYVTSLINKLMTLSIQENDYAGTSFLQWFVDEQVEEEASVDDILQQLKLVEGKGTGLFMLDKEAGSRKPEE